MSFWESERPLKLTTQRISRLELLILQGFSHLPIPSVHIWQLKRLVYRSFGLDFFIFIFIFLWRNKNKKLYLFLTPRKSHFQVFELAKICPARLMKMCTFVFKIRILQSWSPTENDSFPLLAQLCSHVSEGGELGADQWPETKKGKEGKGWRRIIYTVPQGTVSLFQGIFIWTFFAMNRA